MIEQYVEDLERTMDALRQADYRDNTDDILHCLCRLNLGASEALNIFVNGDHDSTWRF